ncbi:MAG: hypothetical protein IAG10_29175 [Planctomycetaceae bacterium]|nr:hypothetical protein [Planctomycetaceae bacterium]
MTTTEHLKLKPPVAAAMEVLSAIPKDSSWDAVMYHLFVRQKIERGLQDAEEGRFIDHDELFEELLRDDDE